jgi:hypothetical protein
LLDVASRMASPKSPSPVIELFVDEVASSFPESEKKKVAAHDDAIAKTTSDGDPHRAHLCAKWAIKMAADKDSKHPLWERLKERHQVWKDEWFAVEFAVGDAVPISGSFEVVGRPAPLLDIWIEWVKNAVAIAKRLGEDDGWENSPWEALLTEMIEYRPS